MKEENLNKIRKLLALNKYNNQERIEKIILGISHFSDEKIAFIAQAIHNEKSGWMAGSMFMPRSGLCYHCGADVLQHAIDNNESGDVTGCYKCYKSYCD